MIKATVVGAVEIKANLNKISTAAKQLISHAVFKGVADVEKEAKMSIQRGGKSGIVYQRIVLKEHIVLLLLESHLLLILDF